MRCCFCCWRGCLPVRRPAGCGSRPMAQPKEKEVTLLFPRADHSGAATDAAPPPPPQKKESTSAPPRTNARTAPKNAAFISDRNTKAATVKAPFPDGTEPLPTMDGLKLPTRELADRDHRDGDLKDDARPKTPRARWPCCSRRTDATHAAFDREAEGCRSRLLSPWLLRKRSPRWCRNRRR
jgi:hypothetical protein